jgi:hypothetical protein
MRELQMCSGCTCSMLLIPQKWLGETLQENNGLLQKFGA